MLKPYANVVNLAMDSKIVHIVYLKGKYDNVTGDVIIVTG
jgi:hypothetical protein